MIDQLLKMADGPLQELLSNSGVNAGPGAASAIESTLSNILQSKAKAGDLNAVKEMFSGNDTDPDSPVVQNLAGDLSSGLMNKLGIDSKQAMSIAMTALPFIMNFFNKRVNDAPMANNALQGGPGAGGADILGTLLGRGDKGGMDLGGLMGMGKGLFK